MSAEGFYFNAKQWLGDDAVLLMDWDVRAMHLHLMCIAWQKTPPGALPDDDTMLRKWLSNPDPQSWIARIKPQLARAWRVEGGHWNQDGLMREWERQASTSQKRRAAANVRWRKGPDEQETVEPSTQRPLITLDGELESTTDAGFSLLALLKDSAAFRIEATKEERMSIWSVGVKLLAHPGFPEDKARSYLGKLIHEHGEKPVAEAVATLSLKPASPADAKSYLVGILKTETTKKRGRGRVAL